jgi:hypothetical protein
MRDSCSQLQRPWPPTDWRTLSPLKRKYSESFRYVNGWPMIFLVSSIGLNSPVRLDEKLADNDREKQKNVTEGHSLPQVV